MLQKLGLVASLLALAWSVGFLLAFIGVLGLAAARVDRAALVFDLPPSPTVPPAATALPPTPTPSPRPSASPTPASPLLASPTPAQLFFRCNDGTRLVGTSTTGACEGRGGIAVVSDVPIPADDPPIEAPASPTPTATSSPAPPPPASPTPTVEATPLPTPTILTSYAPTAPNAPSEAARPTATATPVLPTPTDVPGAPTASPTATATAAPSVTAVAPEQQPQLPAGNPTTRSPIAGLWHKPIEDDVFLGRMVESGAGWVRVFLTWEEVEPTETSPPTYNWAASDRAIRLLRERGIQPLVNIVDPPTWAAFPTCGPFRSTAMQNRWLQFVRAAVERYQQPPYNVRYWVLYNEPDFRIQNPNDKFGGGWGGGCWGNHPTEYGAMLRATYPVIKAADPAATVVLGPLAADGCDPSFNCAFLREVLDPAKGNAAGSFDMASFNYFPFYRRNWEQYGTSLLGKAEGFRRTMAEFGVSKPVLVAETGIVLDGSADAARAQAQYVAQALTLGLVDAGRPDGLGTQVVIWFTLRDSDDPNDRWGLVDPLGTIKEPFRVYQAWVKELAGFRFVRNESEPTYGSSPARVCDSGPYRCDALQKYVFASGDQEKWVLWVDGGPQRQGDRYLTSATRAVEAPAERVIAVRDRTGANLRYEVIGGRARFVVGDSPIYLTLRR